MTEEQIHPVDRRLPPVRLGILGFQHVLVMYAGAVTTPLVIGAALGLAKEQIALLINADLLICGIATLIQAAGVRGVGIRLPIIMGVSVVSIGPIIAVGSNPALGMQGVFGAVIVAGIFALLVAPFIGRVRKFFPPVVMGAVILVIGLTLMKVAANWAAGGQPVIKGPDRLIPNPNYALLPNIALAGLVLVSIVVVARFGRGLLSNLAVLAGLLVGFGVAIALGRVDWAGIATAPWLALVMPFEFGFPKFDLWASLMLCLVMMVVMIESLGMFFAVGEIVEKPVSEQDLTRAIRADGVGTILGGVFNSFVYTSYSQNIGLLQVTGVRSRWVCVASGMILILLGLLPKMAFVVASIPPYVLGGAAIVMFGMVAATGIKILSKVDYSSSQQNLYVVALGVGIGLIPLVAERFFQNFPPSLTPLTHSGIMLTAVVAALLNALFSVKEAEPRHMPTGMAPEKNPDC